MRKIKIILFLRNNSKQEQQKLFLSYTEQLLNMSPKASAENAEHPQRFSRIKPEFLATLL